SRTSARPPGGGCSSTTRSAPTIPSAISRLPRSASNTRKVLLLRCVLDGEAYGCRSIGRNGEYPVPWSRQGQLEVESTQRRCLERVRRLMRQCSLRILGCEPMSWASTFVLMYMQTQLNLISATMYHLR